MNHRSLRRMIAAICLLAGAPLFAQSRPGDSGDFEPLVPGFGLENELPPVPGFGANGDLFSVTVSDRDRRTVDERFRRYDSNRDGYLSRSELARNRWSDDPLIYDRNSDGRLSKDEMAARYAHRRMDEETNRLMSFYVALDRNGNKILEPFEFADNRSRSTIERRIREAGMDPTRPIPLREFMSKRLGNAGVQTDQVRRAVKTFGRSPSKSAIAAQESNRQQEEARRLATFYAGLDRNGNKIIEPSEYADSRYRSTIERRFREAGLDPSRPVALSTFVSRRLQNAGIDSRNASKVLSKFNAPGGQGDRGFYRSKTPHERLPEEIPEWFLERDNDRNGVVAMFEFASDWTEATAAEFERLDEDADGLISPEEVIAATAEGVEYNAAESLDSVESERGEGYSSEMEGAGDAESTSRETPPATAAAGTTKSPPPVKVDPRYLTYAGGMIEKFDANRDGVLVASEWQAMRVDPSPADSNGDGKITAYEYAAWVMSR